MEDVVYEVLERGRGVSHSKGHYKVFEQTIPCMEFSLPFVPWGNADGVIAGAEVNCCIDLGTAESVD